jgi:phosphatidate cytidylyltransferase
MIWQHVLVRSVMGFVVLIPAALALIYAHSQNDGNGFFLYLVGIVVFADVGAYFSGKRWGKKKLAPAVSPGKSWAGFFGGLVSVAIFAAVVASMYPIMGLTALQLIVVTVISALASVLGDLLESMLKRHRGIKDSSQLLPGHGGILDRIDSICAAAPVFVLLSMLL